MHMLQLAYAALAAGFIRRFVIAVHLREAAIAALVVARHIRILHPCSMAAYQLATVGTLLVFIDISMRTFGIAAIHPTFIGGIIPDMLGDAIAAGSTGMLAIGQRYSIQMGAFQAAALADNRLLVAIKAPIQMLAIIAAPCLAATIAVEQYVIFIPLSIMLQFHLQFFV